MGSALPELGMERELSGCPGGRFPVRLVMEVRGELLEPDCLPLVWSDPTKRSGSVRDHDLDGRVADKNGCLARRQLFNLALVQDPGRVPQPAVP